MESAAQPALTSWSALGRRVHPPTIARLMALAVENPTLLSLAAGFTDSATLPTGMVASAVAEVTREGVDREALQYGTNTGRAGLRRLIAERLAQQEAGFDTAELEKTLFITNGSQQALYLAVQVLCDPGDIVLVDRPSYFVFLEMLTGLGVRAVSIPTTDDGGVDGPGLRRLLRDLQERGEQHCVKAVYFVSYYSNPSGRSLSEAEKNTIAVELRENGLRVPVLEDAAYRELYFREPEPASSVFSLAAWQEFPRLYLSTLTKPFATGLKVGYGVCSHPEWLARMLYVKGHHDFGTANFNQAIFERVLARGGLDAHLQVLRPSYERKMRALDASLRAGGLRELGWQWEQPRGGLYLWLQAPEGIDTGLTSAFCRACVDAGVLYVPGALCFGDHIPDRYIRLSFGVLAEEQLQEAGRRFAQVAASFAK